MPYDNLTEKCGVFGIVGSKSAITDCLFGLHALQHRGQESFGFALFSQDKKPEAHYFPGYVSRILETKTFPATNEKDIIAGHVRYSTSGDRKEAQPIVLHSTKFGSFAVAHNGNLVNFEKLRESMILDNVKFDTNIDTEVIARLIARSKEDTLENAVIASLKLIGGAYSLLISDNKTLIAVKDPLGIRPLALGRKNNEILLSSETCGIDALGGVTERELKPGEMLVIKNDLTQKTYFPFEKSSSRFCIFEYVYFARPSSSFDKNSVYAVRKNIGKQLSIESGDDSHCAMVVPVPDSGIPAALGYAEESKMPFEFGLIRNNYVGRTFLQPMQAIREQSVRMKYSVNLELLHDKKIILIDDSIVRGTTLKSVVSILRGAKVKEIHLRISSPPTIFPCFYGIDTPIQDSLLAYKMKIDEMKEFIGADSIKFLSIDGLYKAVCLSKRNAKTPQYCDSCFTGDYPIKKL